MSSVPTTPRGKTSFNPTTPATTRVGATHLTQASPHYATTRRHSLYGVEDRVVIDPGSRIWKVGFSGEGKPRDVFHPTVKAGGGTESLWKLERASDALARAEEDKMLEIRLQTAIRSVFHDSLLTDPKARKVILIESPLLPLYIKDTMARILFENQVPSVSFAPSHLLSLMSVGRITGLVIDCGHLESVALPIFAARPLFPKIQTTPLAGSRLTAHLRALLLTFATYLPPPASLSAAMSVPIANRATRVPLEVLTEEVVEEIKTRCCFVGDPVEDHTVPDDQAMPDSDVEMDVDASEGTQSESDVSRIDSVTSSQAGSSEFSVVTNPQAYASSSKEAGQSQGTLQALERVYKRSSTATDLQMRVTPPVAQQTGTGLGMLLIPGWIRERATEVLFERGDIDESSLAEVILDVLLKIPVDLRKTLASTILVSGGTAMISGFIPRLHAEIIRALSPPPPSSHIPRSGKGKRPPPPKYDKYACLRPLTPFFAIINNPSPPPTKSERARVNAGKGPAFSPAMLAWVGGSLAGSLKTGGAEVAREKWDEGVEEGDTQGVRSRADSSPNRSKTQLPDWTRSPLRSRQ
ncbi:actin-domain-containing protein [Coprinopsis marcescibilis]|uniref:Actin-domain-containing protein n=1 Tax=Coprinopsis marcescibilis TaxID=230819 RepID=A0A5C3L418_COPMA|nr:actin-domain-containing protein [Coprinopsis marcescibilis]